MKARMIVLFFVAGIVQFVAEPIASWSQESLVRPAGSNDLLELGPFIQIPGPNPILIPGLEGTWEGGVVETSDAFKDFGTYYLYYHGNGGDGYQLGVATAPHPLGPFEKYDGNPILERGSSGSWDDVHVACAMILKEGSRNYTMWYSGYGPDGIKKLGYATSNDGLKWTRYGDKPIYDKHWTEDMIVVKHNDLYYMFAEGTEEPGNIQKTNWLTSNDGIDWQRQGELDIRKTDGQPIADRSVGTPAVWHENGKWYLLYEFDNDKAVFLATSPELKVWTHVQDEPVMLPGPSFYDNKAVAVDQVLKYKGRYYMYYHGLGDTEGNWTTNIATSKDLLHWKKYDGNPLVPVKTNKGSGILVHDGKQFRLYTMHVHTQYNQVHVHFPRNP